MADKDVNDLTNYANALLRLRLARVLSFDEILSEAGLVVVLAIKKHDPARGTMRALIFHLVRTRAFSLNRSGSRNRLVYRDPAKLDYTAERPGAYARTES